MIPAIYDDKTDLNNSGCVGPNAGAQLIPTFALLCKIWKTLHISIWHSLYVSNMFNVLNVYNNYKQNIPIAAAYDDKIAQTILVM